MLGIINGKIMTMADETIENGKILIEDGKIKAIGKDIELPKDCEIYDAKGALVTPGLVDAHCHLGMFGDSVGFEGSDGNEVTDPVTPQMRAIDGINPFDGYFKDAYMGGVTSAMTGPGSANTIGGTFAVIKTYGNRIDNMIVKFPAAMKIAFGENPKRVYGSNGKMPYTRMAVAATIREELMKAKEYLAKKENAKEEKDMPPFDMKHEAFIPVLKKEIPLKAHAHRADDIFTSIRIAKEFDLDLTLDHCTDGHLVADELAKEGFPAIVGPTFGDRPKVELKNKTFDTPRVLYEAGMKIAINTDSPVIPLENLPLCAAFAINAGLPEDIAWKSITINAAEISGVGDRVGSLEIGKDADIVIWDKNPLRTVDYKVLATIIDGKIVYRA
ncbi:MAG: amidohydrolase [Tissierellia bacterium]|nr:amidohydrolase [Tissierellia bacterium]